MRIELDNALTKTKLRQVLKLMGNDAKKIKIIMGTEIFDIDTIVSKNDTIYLCTNSKETANFYEKRVVVEPDYDSPIPEIDCDDVIDYNSKGWKREWDEYRKVHGLPKRYVGDTPGFGDDITC